MPSSYTLGEHYEGLIRSLVGSGRYASASEVVRDSLRLLEEREDMRAAKLAALKRAIDDGLASGAPEPLDLEAIKAQAREKRRAAGKGSDSGA